MDLKAHILSAIKGTKISTKMLLDRNIWKFSESKFRGSKDKNTIYITT